MIIITMMTVIWLHEEAITHGAPGAKCTSISHSHSRWTHASQPARPLRVQLNALGTGALRHNLCDDYAVRMYAAPRRVYVVQSMRMRVVL